MYVYVYMLCYPMEWYSLSRCMHACMPLVPTTDRRLAPPPAQTACMPCTSAAPARAHARSFY